MVDTPRYDAGWVRTTDAPTKPPPPNLAGSMGWISDNLVPTWWHGLLSIGGFLFLAWVAWGVIDWGILKAVWTGEDREACMASVEGACWAYVRAKFSQFMYGFYPFGERWRVDAVYIIGLAALVPMLMPSLPYKRENVLFLLVAYPLIVLILLTGGDFDISLSVFMFVTVLVAIAAVALPVATLGIEAAVQQDRLPLMLAAGGLVLWVVSWFLPLLWIDLGIMRVPVLRLAVFVLLAAAVALAVASTAKRGGPGSRSAIASWAVAAVAAFAILALLSVDFGMESVRTDQWGGLMVTLVVAITGIVVSLPLGILLALGRRSDMPIVRLCSVIFIEIWRGVPLITVLFMSSVMLPLFLPEGVTFDKLLRALIGVALFASAYMAEVIRGGLQAIPKGQYEAASALGLSYWRSMLLIVLPQALKIVIPGIVNTFIGLFKDTTLVSIIGIFDLLGIVNASFADPKWASPQTAPTGYFFAALTFWIFCFGMSRYSIFTEERLHTGHKR
ncbi:MAG TPA: amino acid ABC transporter permease [Aestuariivirgaceae bacterium]|nr:amino acid ABC transporter permease [Aestuariivirgaceae bacterium]